MACPGLFSCPHATRDTLKTAETLKTASLAFAFRPLGDREPLIVSVAGCQAGQGPDCGLYEHADLTFQGQRRGYPVIDQELAALSPKIAKLVANCPGGALSRSPKPKIVIELQPPRCLGCGFCVSEDPAFAWSQPVGGYFRLLASGRRLKPTLTYLPPQTVWEPVPTDLTAVSQRLFAIVDLWLLEAQPNEPLLDFLNRTERLDEFSKPLD
jgi:dissimilatory sulfite reductase (desulfoviridin) alpha/beta subunit